MNLFQAYKLRTQEQTDDQQQLADTQRLARAVIQGQAAINSLQANLTQTRLHYTRLMHEYQVALEHHGQHINEMLALEAHVCLQLKQKQLVGYSKFFYEQHQAHASKTWQVASQYYQRMLALEKVIQSGQEQLAQVNEQLQHDQQRLKENYDRLYASMALNAERDQNANGSAQLQLPPLKCRPYF